MADDTTQKGRFAFNPFENISANFVRNPLGIIALFIVLVYAMAAVVAVGTSGLSSFNQTTLILFLVLFPVLVLALFFRLVTKHATALYGPADLGAQNFLDLHNKVAAKSEHADRLAGWLDADPANRGKLETWIKAKGLNISPTSFIYDAKLAGEQQAAIRDLQIP